jgi:hypothetical protein
MSIGDLQFVPLNSQLLPACRDFNERLRCAGADRHAVFGCSANAARQDELPAPMQVERYVGVDAGGAVRGAYALRWQYLWSNGKRLLAAHYGFPVSEGIINKRYTMVGAAVLRDAVMRCEYLYTLGADGLRGNVYSVARHAGWAIADIPFLFRVINGGRFVRNLPQVRCRTHRRVIAASAALTGVAQFSIAMAHLASALRNGGTVSLRSTAHVSLDVTRSLCAAADEVWLHTHPQYEFCVVRDAGHVGPCFPDHRATLHRLVVRRHGAVIGWAVVMTKDLLRLRRYLGDVSPGLIVDAFGDTAAAGEIVRAATAYLADQGVDVVITNASHRAWVAAYRQAGFIDWHSQFPLMVSRSIGREVGDLITTMPKIHMSRGDGDGVHYLN